MDVTFLHKGSGFYMNSSSSACGEPQSPALKELGWTEEYSQVFSNYRGPYVPGRVACRQKTVWDVFIDRGSVMAGISGALRKLGRFPAVGDFVVVHHQPGAGTSTIVDILPQKTRFTRGASGREGTDQVIAANIDTVFIVTAAGHDLSARRIERYLALAHASGARSVIVINKSDLTDDPASVTREITRVSSETPVITISALSGAGIDRLGAYLIPGTTIVLIGSSGVGKSTLINRLLGRSVQETSDIRTYDGKGRHTTTVRQLFILKNGTLMIDNPGLREVSIGTASAGIAGTFPDILELAEDCHFSDCRHDGEPGCAVIEAVSRGILPQKRLDNYHRLTKELAFEQEKSDIGLVRYEKKRWKAIKSQARHMGDAKSRF
jgi:ribosome biogenesis GTPase